MDKGRNLRTLPVPACRQVRAMFRPSGLPTLVLTQFAQELCQRFYGEPRPRGGLTTLIAGPIADHTGKLVPEFRGF